MLFRNCLQIRSRVGISAVALQLRKTLGVSGLNRKILWQAVGIDFDQLNIVGVDPPQAVRTNSVHGNELTALERRGGKTDIRAAAG